MYRPVHIVHLSAERSTESIIAYNHVLLLDRIMVDVNVIFGPVVDVKMLPSFYVNTYTSSR